MRAWKETKQYKNPKHIYIYSKTCRVTHIFSGKFKNTVMSFKIGFVQRHRVAFQVTGAMRWHVVICVVWPLMNNINTDVKVSFSSAQFLIEENGDIKWACLLIDPALYNTPMLPLDSGQKKNKTWGQIHWNTLDIMPV